MKTLSIPLLSAMLLLPCVIYAGKPPSFLDKIKTDLADEISKKENRKFDPRIHVYGTDYPGDWSAVVNDDYLRGVVTVFEAADLLPSVEPPTPWYETRETGFIIGVLTSALIVFLLK